MSKSRSQMVVTLNGKKIVMEGWRAWIMGTLALSTVGIILFVVCSLILGAVITVSTLMLVLLPLILGAAILASLVSLFRKR